MPPSLKDVARIAGVNASTASRAIRGDPTQRINPATRQRVLEAAEALGYRANYLGRSLRRQTTGTIGLLVPNLDFFTFVDITHGVQAAAIERDLSLLLVEVDQFRATHGAVPADELIYQRLVAEGRVDGLIIGSRTLEDGLVRRLAERRFPLVLVNRRVSGLPSVTGRDEDACRLAVEQLAVAGHHRVGMVGVVIPGEEVVGRRERAFRRAVKDFGLARDDTLIVQSPMSDEAGRVVVHQLFDNNATRPPTAIFIASLSTALGVLEGIRELGLAVPSDLSVVAFPDHPIARHSNPPLTTVTAPLFRMGHEAGRLLIARIEGAVIESVQLPDPPGVVDRGSVARRG